MTIRDYFKCAVSVVIALILSLYLTSDVTSDMIMGLIGGNADFEVSDFYNRVDAGRNEKMLNTDIVIVNSDDVISRDSIAILIERIAAHDPAVIGIDILFRNPKESIGDSLLLDVFATNKNKIVGAIALFGNGEDEFTYIDDSILLGNIPSDAIGAVNLVAIPGGIVRSFLTFFKAGSDIIPSFATSIASRYMKTSADKIIASRFDNMKLRYSNEVFPCIDPGQLMDCKCDLKDKIVLVGTLSDPMDMHPTPIDPAYPGVLIQAEIISTMIAEDFISAAGDFMNMGIAVLISFLLCVVYVRFDSNNAQNLILRLLLMAVGAVGIILGCVLYCDFYIYINIAMILLVIVLSQFVLDIFYGVEEIRLKFKKIGLTSNRSLVVALLTVFGSSISAYADGTYIVHDVKGVVIRMQSGQHLTRGNKVKSNEMLGMEKNRELIIFDSINGKLYVSKSQVNTTVENIVKDAKIQSKSIMKRIYSEMLSNFKRQDNRRNASTGVNIGAVMRDDNEELNENSEYVYSYLSYLLSSKDGYNDSKLINLIAHEVSTGIVWWSIHNLTSVPLYVNILQIPETIGSPSFIFESDVDMPSLLIAPGTELDLPHQYFTCAERRYLLVATEFPFDSNDINTFFADGASPLPLSDSEVKDHCMHILFFPFSENNR